MAKTNHFGALAAAAGALVAVALLVLVDAQPAGATFPGKNGKIAYTGVEGNNYEILTVDPGGGSRFNVTRSAGWDDLRPDYSPSGRRIAYSGLDDGNDYDIFTIDATGGSSFNVTERFDDDDEIASEDTTPSYHPNGSYIAYRGSDGFDEEIYVVSINGRVRFKVTSNRTGDFDPDYSPDGQKIAYSGWDGRDYEIYTINVGGGTPRQLTDNRGNDFRPDYSPDGQRIAYEGSDGNDYEIYTIDAQRPDPIDTYKITSNTTHDGDPSWGREDDQPPS